MSSLKTFPLCSLKMAESFENLENILPGWANKDVERSPAEAVCRYVKQEVQRKTRVFLVGKDLEKKNTRAVSVAPD